MDWFEESEELEFEDVTCNCNLKSNDRFYRLYIVISFVLMTRL